MSERALGIVMQTVKSDLTVDPHKLDDKALEDSITKLLKERGESERDLLAVMLVERHHRARASESASWLLDCETLFLLATETYEDEHGNSLPLWTKYSASGGSWGTFALDILEIPITTATARKRIWEVYRRRLGWTLEVLTRIGPSRLSVAVAEVERSLSSGGDDELEGMLLGDGSGADNSDWRDIWLHCQAKNDERRKLAGKPARVKFRNQLVVDEGTGEVTGFGLSTWYDELLYELGTFVWNPELPLEVRDTLEVALMDALQRGPRRL